MTNDYKTEEMIEDIFQLEEDHAKEIQDAEADSLEFDSLDDIEEMIPYE